MMIDDPDEGDDGPEPTEADLGPPVDLSPLQEEHDDARFADRVQRAIHRRLLGSSVVEFCVIAPAVVVLELIRLVESLFHRDPSEGGDR